MTAAVALGIEPRGSFANSQCIRLAVQIAANGEMHELSALLDSGTEDDFVSQRLLKELDITPVPAPNLRGYDVNGQEISIYGRYGCDVHASDKTDKVVVQNCDFISTSMIGCDAILGIK